MLLSLEFPSSVILPPDQALLGVVAWESLWMTADALLVSAWPTASILGLDSRQLAVQAVGGQDSRGQQIEARIPQQKPAATILRLSLLG